MSSPPIHISAQGRERNVIPVDWRIGFTRPKGVVFVIIPDDLALPAAAIAELTAIRFLVDSRQVGTSLRHHEVMVSQKAVRDLAGQTAAGSALIPYGRHLYLYVDPERVAVGPANWGEGVEVDPARISVTTAQPAAWPGVFCPALNANVGITRHALDRLIARAHLRSNPWHAFQTATRRLGDSGVRIVPREEAAQTNPGLRLNERTVVLHHPATDTAWIVVKEAESWVLVTMYPHFQALVPTLVCGRIEYRRNT